MNLISLHSCIEMLYAGCTCLRNVPDSSKRFCLSSLGQHTRTEVINPTQLSIKLCNLFSSIRFEIHVVYLAHTMAPKSLLRYIFRHGPHSKARSSTSLTVTIHEQETKSLDTSKSLSRKHSKSPISPPESQLAHKSRSESRQSSVLENIVEETYGDTDNTSIAEMLAALDIGIDSFTTRGLVTASVDEAIQATHAHLDTINTTLALLDTLTAFSATIGVLRKEMEEKRRLCQEKLAMLEDVETAVTQMAFGDEAD